MKSTHCFRKAALLTVFCATLGFVGHSPANAQDEPRTAGEDQNAVSDSSETYRQLNLFGDVFERSRCTKSHQYKTVYES